ncbi:MAG: Mandelate racemase/muconate lactonizing protein [Microgenomates group bacterium GW2011_GWA1_48_10]|nr:MAG: Mandelate racemase/muconate lactonizing protein [Microgenomates group bacterium GW2011_GWA1_48_10]
MVKLVNYELESIPVPFRLSWGKLGYSRHVYVTVENEKGAKGRGEGVLYKTTHLELLPYLENRFTLDLERLAAFEPALAFAVDTAHLDLKGKILVVPPNPSVVREIFMEDQDLEQSVKEIATQHTSAIKLKVGAGVENDKKTLVQVHHLTKGKIKIHLDANRAYNLKDALELASFASARGVTLFEEPVSGGFPIVGEFKRASNLPVMLDESIQSAADLESAIREKCFDILNIKLSRLGGITLAQRYVQRCTQAGLRIYLGCSEELETGTRAIFTLAKSTKNLYAVEGLGFERLAGREGFHYSLGEGSRRLFLLKEFSGLWATRIENCLNYTLAKIR